MPEQPMIERIARVCAVWADHHAPDAWLAYQGLARLILAEMRGQTTPQVWRIMIDTALAEPDQTKPE